MRDAGAPAGEAGARVAAAASLRALALANARYWPTVAPVTRRELARWRTPAQQIGEPGLRALALGKLEHEGFNAEVAVTLATLAPRARRQRVVRAIVALELLFDYLDGRTERRSDDPLAHGQAAFAPFLAAVATGGRASAPPVPCARGWEDWQYMSALSAGTRRELEGLPGAQALAAPAARCAARCAQAQTRIHAAALRGDSQLQAWASEDPGRSGLGWREYAAGAASSVLAVHALIAAAASEDFTQAHAERLEHAYLAIGAVITLLDALADAEADAAAGEANITRLFAAGELQELLPALVREALARASETPHAAHHTMTLAGVAAYYTTHPGARAGQARLIAVKVRRELSPTIWPTLAVMGAWRAAKAARRSVSARTLNGAEQPSDAPVRDAGIQ